MTKRIISLAFCAVSWMLSAQSTHTLNLQVGKPGAPISPTMYGVFFEDINFGADGGLYAELIKNRSFEFPQSLMGWKSFGKVEVLTQGAPFDLNPHYIRLGDPGHPHKWSGIENEGFRGIGVKQDASYRFSVWARTSGSLAEEKIRVELVDAHNNTIQKQEIAVNSPEWKRYELTMKSTKTDTHARLRIFMTTRGSLDLEHISLFPVDTWKGRENGLRKDLAQALYDLKPGLFRFPGGCIVEGTDISDRYDWKKSVGRVENRPLNSNRWHYTFPHRFDPDYFQSYGMGFYEFFLLSEDLGAEPLPVINCGLACQYQNSDEKAHIALDDLDPFIQDALDLVEFANGATSTPWGKLRAEMGHPAPFGLKYLGVGNEQWGKEYPARLELFVKALRAKHPEIQIIGSSGPNAEGKEFDYLWPEMKRLKVDLVDEHYYRSPEWFLAQGARYDNYDRKGPKVFAGEYACHVKSRKNSFESALCEAAFMTGLERNADIVTMCTYAPLFAHVDGWQWRPDLIWFDNLRSVRSANYYIQQLYGHNAGTHVLSLTENKKPLTGDAALFASSVWDEDQNRVIIKMANTSTAAKQITINIGGLKRGEQFATATQTLFAHPEAEQENTLDTPDAVIPVTTPAALPINNRLAIDLPAKSFMMVVLKK